MSQTVPEKTNLSNAGQLPAAAGGGRARAANVLLLVAVLAVLAAGGWSLFSYLSTGAPPARIGENVEVPGGTMRVENVTPEHMAPMQSNKFSAGGMSMSSMGMDMAPEGFRRFAVNMTLAGSEDAGLTYAAKDFRVTGEKMGEVAPIRHQFAGGTVPAGSAVSGNMVFQVPEKATNLLLSLDGGRPVALDLPAAKDGGHGHGGAAEDGHGH